MTDISSLCLTALAAAALAGMVAIARRRPARRRAPPPPPARVPRAVPVIPLIEVEDAGEASEFHLLVAPRSVSIDADAEADDGDTAGGAATFELDAAGSTDCGRERVENQDRLLLLEDEHVFVVADGMGGHAGGGVASELAINVIADSVLSLAGNAIDVHGGRMKMPRAAAELIRAVSAANEAVRRTADADHRLSDMGTTVVAARFCLEKQRLYVTHVGDSRCYRLRDGRMRQVTLDHTMSALGVTGPQEHHLSRAVGTRANVEPDIAVLKPRPGDAYVLCSDGLTKMVTDEAIAAVISTADDAAAAASELIRVANGQGGKDNVTAIVVRVVAT